MPKVSEVNVRSLQAIPKLQSALALGLSWAEGLEHHRFTAISLFFGDALSQFSMGGVRVGGRHSEAPGWRNFPHGPLSSEVCRMPSNALKVDSSRHATLHPYHHLARSQCDRRDGLAAVSCSVMIHPHRPLAVGLWWHNGARAPRLLHAPARSTRPKAPPLPKTHPTLCPSR